MALSLARSPSPSPGAALPGPALRVPHFALPLLPLRSPRRQHLRLRVAASSPPEAQAAAAAAPVSSSSEEEQGEEKRRKLYVANLPWSFPAPEIEKLFAQHGTVKDVEVIKGKDGRNRGFAFVTMSTAEEAATAAEKLNAHDVKGRSIKVEFSKSFRKPAPPPPIIERHKLYVSNLPWKARSPNVKEFFARFNPLSANVIFDNGKAAGYGFVSFGTKEEAEAALTELDGKELLGRPVRLNWRESDDDKVDIAKAGSDVEVVNTEGASIGDASTDGGEDKLE